MELDQSSHSKANFRRFFLLLNIGCSLDMKLGLPTAYPQLFTMWAEPKPHGNLDVFLVTMWAEPQPHGNLDVFMVRSGKLSV